MPRLSTRLSVVIMHEVVGSFPGLRLRRLFRNRFVSISNFSRAAAFERRVMSSMLSFGRELELGGMTSAEER